MTQQNNQQFTTPAASFAEITGLVAALPKLPVILADYKEALYADRQLAPLGQWRDTGLWIGQSQHRFPPRLNRPRLAIFAAPHGHAGSVDMNAVLSPWQDGSAATARLLAAQSEVDLQVYEMASTAPTGNITTGPALTEEAAAHAMAYGMMAAEPGLDLLCLSSASDEATGAEASALAVICALLKTDPTSMSLADSLTQKIETALTANRARMTDPLTILATLGGYESCAMVGAILAARLAQIPVLVEGLPALAAILTLAKLGGPNARDLLAHVQATGVPVGLLTEIEKIVALVPSWSLKAGDGLQCAAALPLIRAVVGAA